MECSLFGLDWWWPLVSCLLRSFLSGRFYLVHISWTGSNQISLNWCCRISSPKEWGMYCTSLLLINCIDISFAWVSLSSYHGIRTRTVSKHFEGLTDQTEPWYGTAYSREKIQPELVEVIQGNYFVECPYIGMYCLEMEGGGTDCWFASASCQWIHSDWFQFAFCQIRSTLG